MKNKSLNFIVPLVIYPFDVMVSFGESDIEVEKLLKKFQVDYIHEHWRFEDIGVGRTIMFKGGQTLLRLKKIPVSCEEHGLLAHEIFHSVQFLMKKLTMKLCMRNCEAYAYLIGYLTEQIYKKIK